MEFKMRLISVSKLHSKTFIKIRALQKLIVGPSNFNFGSRPGDRLESHGKTSPADGIRFLEIMTGLRDNTSIFTMVAMELLKLHIPHIQTNGRCRIYFMWLIRFYQMAYHRES